MLVGVRTFLSPARKASVGKPLNKGPARRSLGAGGRLPDHPFFKDKKKNTGTESYRQVTVIKTHNVQHRQNEEKN